MSIRAFLLPSLLLLFLLLPVGWAEAQYKRIHQQALVLLQRDRLDALDAALAKSLRKNPGDAETLLFQAVSEVRRGQAPAAERTLQQALEAGLPPERILLGPPEVSNPLRKIDAIHTLALKRTGPLLGGPLLGDVTPDGARIWVRLREPGKATIRVVPLGDGGEPTEFSAEGTAATDRTAVIQVHGLRPETEYRYEVRVADQRVASGQFETSPPTGQGTRFTLAFGGGAGYVPENERVWQTIEKQRPDLLLLLGDNVYIDAPENRSMQRYCYYRRQSRPEWRALTAHVPTYAIWDDHDFGTNDCWGGPRLDQPAWKPEVWEVFRQNWANPAYGGGERPGCYFTFRRGDVQFFLLDGRYYRTNPRVDAPSMLGPEQLAWLKRELAASEATFKILCSPVPWTFEAKGSSRDTWNGFQAERESLFGYLAEREIAGVLLLSADRHRSDAWKIERESAYDLLEFNSSRLTNQHVHGVMQRAIFSYNAKQSFGLVDLDTTATPPTATYRVITIDGEEVERLRAPLDALR